MKATLKDDLDLNAKRIEAESNLESAMVGIDMMINGYIQMNPEERKGAKEAMLFAKQHFEEVAADYASMVEEVINYTGE